MRSWIHSAPLVRVAIPLAIGSAFGIAVEPSLWACLAAFVLAVSSSIALTWGKKYWKSYRYNPFFGGVAALAFISIGFSWAGLRLDGRQYTRVAHPQDSLFFATMDAYPIQKANSTQLLLQVRKSSNAQGEWSVRSYGTVAYVHKDLQADTLRAGDALVFSTAPLPHRKPLNPEMFDYGRYLTHQGYPATVYLKSDVAFIRDGQVNHSPKVYFERWRQGAIESFAEHAYHPDALGVIAALVLGKRELVDPEIRQAFADAGAVHILAVSGLHVGIIYLFATFLLGKMLPGKRLAMVRLIASLLLLWLYAGITGFSPSVLRAATMFSFLAIGRQYDRFGNIFNMLAASAILLLLINPFLITAAGFQLSYLAVIGIVALHPVIYPLFTAPWWWLDKIWSLAVVSLAAQIATFPVSMHYFNQFPNWFLLSNLAVIPLATVLLYSGILSIMLSWIPHVSTAVFFLTDAIAHLLNRVVLAFQGLPSPVSEGLYLTKMEVGLCYLLFFAFGWAVKDPRRGRLRLAQGLTFLLVLSFGIRKISGALRQEIYCFHAEGYSMLTVSKGRTVHVFSPDLKDLNQSAINYAVKGYFTARGIKNKKLFSDSRIVVASGFKAIFVHDSDELAAAATTDADAIICRGRWDHIEEVPVYLSNDAVLIIDSSVPWYRRSDLAHWFISNGVSFHSTAAQGAIRL